MAEGLLEEGCEVVIVGSSEGVHRVAEEFHSRGFACHGVQADLGSREQTLACFRSCMELLGGDLDILVNAHGIQRRHQPEEFPLSDWDDVISVNLSSVFVLCQEAGRVMLPKGRGKIINIASMLSFQGGIRVPAYTSSKSAVMGMTKALANEWAKYGINVNAIAPGYMATNNTNQLRQDEDRSEEILARIPAGRWGTPADVGGAAIFLASDAAAYVNGYTLAVDGGWLAR